MIDNKYFRKVIIIVLSVLLIFIIWIFPPINEETFNEEIKYIDEKSKNTIYLLDNNNYISKTSMPINSIDINNKVKEIINSLTINSEKSEYLPHGFKALIPQGTILNSLSLNNGLLKLDFNDKFINTKDIEKQIEALIYSLTNIDEIKEILIFINGEHLSIINNVAYPNPLNRDFGINKIYDITNYKNITKTTIYYLGKNNNQLYYIPVSKYTNDNNNKVEIIINELKSNPTYNTNLMSYLASSVELENYELLEKEINLSFNENILDNLDLEVILEEVKYTIALSINDIFDVNTINFFVNNKKIDSISTKNLE